MTAELINHLVQAMEQWDTIDSHEHLGPEKDRVSSPVDVFTLFSHYTKGDLYAAGMSEASYQSLLNRDIPLEKRWELFEPYWENIRWGSFARAALIAAEKFYGYDDINRQTYRPLSEAIQKANVPGIYNKVLRDACKIRVALTQCRSTKLDHPILKPLMPLVYDLENWEALNRPEFDSTCQVRSLDDYLAAMWQYIARVKSEGAVGLKLWLYPFSTPQREAAVSAFRQLQDGTKARLPFPNPLRDYVVDQVVSFATEQDMVVAVHTGYWRDFRSLDPLHVIPLLQRHPKCRFDIYHLGFPWVRQTLMLGKGFPNVWINLCWNHIISQRCTTSALEEAIDLVPMNKILAFGGDYRVPVEKIYGHLVMAREDVATALSARIVAGRMSETQALDQAHKWFWDNPKELYRLDV